MAQGSSEGGSKYLTARFQIGSCKGPLSYGGAETVFHPDDVPETKKQNRTETNAWKRGGVAPGDKALWNQSSITAALAYRRTRVNSEFDRPNMYQYNLRAEQLPPKNVEHIPTAGKFKIDVMPEETKRRIRAIRAADSVLNGRAKSVGEMPINPKLDGKTAWNQSSEFLKGPVDARDSAVAVRARANSARHSTALKGYVPPHKLDYSYRPPEEAPSLPFAQSPTYNRHATRATEKTRTFAHSGVFEFNGQEGQWMWSDTASCVRESPGDVVKVTNPNALNFASPTTTL